MQNACSPRSMLRLGWRDNWLASNSRYGTRYINSLIRELAARTTLSKRGALNLLDRTSLRTVWLWRINTNEVHSMFKNLQQELKKLGRTREIAVPIESDPEGYLDKECPSEPCLFLFKIHGDDWSNIVRDEEVFCPSCGHVASAKSWYPRAQVEAARDYVLGTITNSMNKAMRADAAASKRRQNRKSFLSITLDVKGGRDAVLVPVAAAEPMRLRV